MGTFLKGWTLPRGWHRGDKNPQLSSQPRQLLQGDSGLIFLFCQVSPSHLWKRSAICCKDFCTPVIVTIMKRCLQKAQEISVPLWWYIRKVLCNLTLVHTGDDISRTLLIPKQCLSKPISAQTEVIWRVRLLSNEQPVGCLHSSTHK